MITCDSTPYGDGPVRHLDRVPAPRLVDRTSAPHRAAVAFVISWLPLMVLAALEGVAFGRFVEEPLVIDFLAMARYAVAVPLLVA